MAGARAAEGARDARLALAHMCSDKLMTSPASFDPRSLRRLDGEALAAFAAQCRALGRQVAARGTGHGAARPKAGASGRLREAFEWGVVAGAVALISGMALLSIWGRP